MVEEISKKQAEKALQSGYAQSEILLKNKDELELFLHRLEKKIADVPIVGETLAIVPTMISLVKNFVEGKYTAVPYGTIVAVVSALGYFLSPIDIIPDGLPGVGHVDDAVVITVCLACVKTDLEFFDEWRKSQGMI